MKRSRCLILVICIAVCLSGCAGDMPNMSKQQSEMVAEYSAALLLKYDSENHSRLVETKQFMDSYNQAKKVREDAKAAYEAQMAAQEEQRRQEALNQEAAQGQYGEATTPNDPIPNEKNDDYNGGAYLSSAMSIDEFLGLSDFSIIYGGYDIMNSYPEDAGSDIFFSLDATKSNDLLIVYFNVSNLTSETKQLDVFNQKAKFRLSVNGENYVTALPTMLEDDLSMYLNDINGNSTKRLVLVIEIPENTTVNSLSMTVSTGVRGSITKMLSE